MKNKNNVLPPPPPPSRFVSAIYWAMPAFLKIIAWRYIDAERYALRKEIMRFLKKELTHHPDKEKQELFDYLKRNPISMISYPFRKKYEAKKVAVYTDDSCNMKYVLHDKKKLYFCRSWSALQIQRSYNGLLMEQDMASPHRYEMGDFSVQEGDTVADVGAAEGIFALSVVERAKKLYLFECEEEWIDALKMTFAPWKEKVVIVNKYVSDINDGHSITLDDFLKGGELNFVKADIEGAEIKLLKGFRHTLSAQNNLRMVLCTYHRANDAEELQQALSESGFATTFSERYVTFIYDKNLSPPYLRRGVIRAAKQ